MLDIPSISSIVAAVGVLIGVVFTVLELRDLVKTRRVDLVTRLYSTFGSTEFVEAWEKIRTRESVDDFDAYKKKHGLSEYIQVCTLFEGIGILLDRRLIDNDLADDLFGVPVRLAWERMRVLIQEDRKQTNEPGTFEWFEYLYNKMQKREQRQASKTA